MYSKFISLAISCGCPCSTNKDSENVNVESEYSKMPLKSDVTAGFCRYVVRSLFYL
jgi:hypothetical protein